MKYLLYNIFFILIVLIFAYINSIPKKEPFTPRINSKINAYYRPLIRRTRLATESFKDGIKNGLITTIDKLAEQLGFL